MPPIKRPKRKRHGHFLKAWREHRKDSDPKFTQAYMAEHLGVNRTTYGRIENEQIPYNQDHLELASEALGCHPSDILAGAPGDTESPWTYWLQLSPTQRHAVLGLMKDLARGKVA
jgi:DNA-binding XRE family transcriptional regulator